MVDLFNNPLLSLTNKKICVGVRPTTSLDTETVTQTFRRDLGLHSLSQSLRQQAIAANESGKKGIVVSVPDNSDRTVRDAILGISNQTRPQYEGQEASSTHIKVQLIVRLGEVPSALSATFSEQDYIEKQMQQIEAALKRGEDVLVKIESTGLGDAGAKIASWMKDPKIKAAKSLDVRVYGEPETKAKIISEIGRGFGVQQKITPKEKTSSTVRSFAQKLESAWSKTIGIFRLFYPARVPVTPVSQNISNRYAKSLAAFARRLDSTSSTTNQVQTIAQNSDLKEQLAMLAVLANKPQNKGRIFVELNESARATLGIPQSAPKYLNINGEALSEVRSRLKIGLARIEEKSQPKVSQRGVEESSDFKITRYLLRLARQSSKIFDSGE